MPATKVIKSKPVEASRKTLEQTKPAKVRALNGAGNGLKAPAVRNSRASSCPRCPQRDRCERGTGAQRTAVKASCERRASHKAFTVIPPNPKKRREIQRKAEAELAALEELRLSRAMAYVSINPSSVGGCMSLEEVRLKQQQEMMQAKRKPMKTQVMEQTPVLKS
ncbi:epithelial-stromal interaction protein 1 [Enoplosus armatus]|uniref:epithelial-stromal interaction protein 1 n=1 Tax=Enoplosus armatus TaxID=215367 RepID=UPI0039928A4F